MKNKSVNSIRIGVGIATIAIAMLAVLAAFSTPAMAQDCFDPIATDTSYGGGSGSIVNGTVIVKHCGETPNPWTFTLPEGEKKFARMSIHSWGGCDPATHATFCNGDGVCEDLSISNDCAQNPTQGTWFSDMGTYHYYWMINATPGENSFTAPPGCDCRWKYLVVVINETPEQHRTHEGYWWANIGLVKEINHTTWFNGPIDNTVNHTLWVGQSHDEDITLYFNEQWLANFPGGGWESSFYTCNVSTDKIETDGTNSMKWHNEYSGGYDDFFPWIAVLAEQISDVTYYPDLEVTGKEIKLNTTSSCPDQTKVGFVVSHTYDVRAEVKNTGEASTSSQFDVTLYDNETSVQTNRIGPLGVGESVWTTFQWTPSSDGTRPLRIMADSGYEVTEKFETNNNLTQDEYVYPVGQADLFAYPGCINFTPAWQSNKTKIIVTVLNDGTGDANNFQVTVTVRNATTSELLHETSQTTSVCAKAKRELTFAPDYELTKGNVTNVTVELDSGGAVGESNEGNNVETKFYEAIAVTLKVSHHYGNTSDYNGVLTDYHTMEMFDILKVVTNYTTAWQLLTSETDVCQWEEDCNNPDPVHKHYVYGLNRSAEQGSSTWYMNESFREDQTPIAGHYILWYPYMNGIPMPTKYMPYEWGDYQLNDGEVMHMDINKWINPGVPGKQFKSRPVTDYTEPFWHGYGGTAWDTTIVYPDGSSDYLEIAEKIKDKLNDTVPDAKINVKTNASSSLTDTEKQNNHLILIGPYSKNSIIQDINANHTDIGMPVYFREAEGDMFDDWDNTVYDHGEVVESCDNPFNNSLTPPWEETWRDTSQTIWIASGVDDAGAKEAAEMLINRTDELDRFWVVQPERSYSEQLYTSSNYISLPLKPNNNGVSIVLASIDGNYTLVGRLNATTKEFESYDPDFPEESAFTIMDPGRLYDIVTTVNCAWSHDGTTSATMNIQLYTSSNYIGWPSMNTDGVSSALSSIAGNYTLVGRLNATTKEFESYDPDFPEESAFTTMDPKRGYDIVTAQDCMWTAPPDC